MKNNNNLTPKQVVFSDQYIITGSASEAYRIAFDCENMKSTTIHSRACELLKKEKIMSYIKEEQDKLIKQTDVTKQVVIDKLMSIVERSEGYLEAVEKLQSSDGNKYKTDKSKLYLLSNFCKTSDAINALKQISKMLGFDAPVKMELDQSVVINIVKPD